MKRGERRGGHLIEKLRKKISKGKIKVKRMKQMQKKQK
jgi:hypothetical protein